VGIDKTGCLLSLIYIGKLLADLWPHCFWSSQYPIEHISTWPICLPRMNLDFQHTVDLSQHNKETQHIFHDTPV